MVLLTPCSCRAGCAAAAALDQVSGPELGGTSQRLFIPAKCATSGQIREPATLRPSDNQGGRVYSEFASSKPAATRSWILKTRWIEGLLPAISILPALLSRSALTLVI